MKTTIATFFAAHKTTVLLASAALVIGAKAMPLAMQNNSAQMVAGQQQMQMQQGYNQQMPRQNGNEGPGYFDSWFGGNGNEEGEGLNYNTGSGYANQMGGNNSYMPAVTNTFNGDGAYSNYNAGNAVDYTSGWAKQQESLDGQHERFTDYIRDEAKYNDADGNTYKLSSGYDYNYVNTTTNEYLQTNDAGVTPGAYSNYTAVTPGDYSGSSSAAATGE